MGLRDKLRRLTRAAERDTIAFTLEDGTVKRFYEDEFLGCFVHEFARDRRAWGGEEPGPPHPIIEALRHVSEDELQRVIKEQGTMLGHLVGEDERIRNGGGLIEDLSER
jgi:hypothetical protein